MLFLPYCFKEIKFKLTSHNFKTLLDLYVISIEYWVNQKFGNILVRSSLQCIYHMTEAVQAVVVTRWDWWYIGALTSCALPDSVIDLKATQINVQRNLIR